MSVPRIEVTEIGDTFQFVKEEPDKRWSGQSSKHFYVWHFGAGEVVMVWSKTESDGIGSFARVGGKVYLYKENGVVKACLPGMRKKTRKEKVLQNESEAREVRKAAAIAASQSQAKTMKEYLQRCARIERYIIEGFVEDGVELEDTPAEPPVESISEPFPEEPAEPEMEPDEAPEEVAGEAEEVKNEPIIPTEGMPADKSQVDTLIKSLLPISDGKMGNAEKWVDERLREFWQSKDTYKLQPVPKGGDAEDALRGSFMPMDCIVIDWLIKQAANGSE